MLHRTKRHLHTVLVVPALVMMLALAGCSGSDDEPKDADTSDKTSTSSTDSTSGITDAEIAEKSGGNPERTFGSTDEAVIEAVTSATGAEKAEWDGKVLRVFVEGSISDPTAGLYCSSIHALIADDEQGVFVYGDGEFDCETRR